MSLFPDLLKTILFLVYLIILNTKAIHTISVKIIWKMIYMPQFQILGTPGIKTGVTNCSQNFSMDMSLMTLIKRAIILFQS